MSGAMMLVAMPIASTRAAVSLPRRATRISVAIPAIAGDSGNMRIRLLLCIASRAVRTGAPSAAVLAEVVIARDRAAARAGSGAAKVESGAARAGNGAARGRVVV